MNLKNERAYYIISKKSALPSLNGAEYISDNLETFPLQLLYLRNEVLISPLRGMRP